MTKADLVSKIALKTGLTKVSSEKVVNGFLASVKEVLLNESRLNISRLGTFAVQKREERTARNPRTGETLNISACKVVKFYPGKKLKDSIQ